jgi:hypothetical protein
MHLQEYNKYEALLNDLEVSRKRVKVPVSLKNAEAQTNQTSHLFKLRRDYAGILGKNRFDDRTAVLSERFNTKIYKVIVFESDKGLVAAKFFYFSSTNPTLTFEGTTAVPNSYLLRCKTRSAELNPPNFFKLFKIKTSTAERRIIKFEIVANSSIRYEFGDKSLFEEMENDDAVYSFDINTSEYPTSMFGSAIQTPSQDWLMESLGT